jgi:hypothetical protein
MLTIIAKLRKVRDFHAVKEKEPYCNADISKEYLDFTSQNRHYSYNMVRMHVPMWRQVSLLVP